MMDNITDYRIIKRDMMKLWKDTFHDSDRYIDLVFKTYFTPDNVFVRYDENRLIASLLCVPYEFQILSQEGKKRTGKGMYLCGLTTHPDYRKRGIMSELMLEAERSASERDFELTFLIPANNHLREYYFKKGYVNASYREFLEGIDTNHHSAKKLNIYSIKNLFKKDDTDFLLQLADWCREKELNKNVPTLVHSRLDMMTIMAENENSIFLTEDTFDLKYPILEKIVAVAFPNLTEERDKPITVVGLYTKSSSKFLNNDSGIDIEVCKAVKNALCKQYRGQRVEFLLPYEESLNRYKSQVEPYAMVKMINANRTKNENMTFHICLMLD